MPSFAQNALAGFQIGQYIGNRGVREREQRAHEAERMFRELQMVFEIEKLGIANQELKRGIVERAQQDAQWVDLTTAAKAQHTQARAQLGDMAPEPMDFMDQGALQLAGSNPHAQQYLKARQEFELKQAQAGFYQARPEMAAKVLESREDTAEANRLSREKIVADQIEAANKRATEKIQAQFDLLSQKHENVMEELDFRKGQELELEKMRSEARLAVAQGQVSREQWLNRHLNTTVTDIANTKAGAKLTPEERHSTAIKLLGDAWDLEIGSRRQGGTTNEPTRRKEIIRVTKDGKRAVFDAETKKFLRYAD